MRGMRGVAHQHDGTGRPSTSLQCTHDRQTTRGNLIQIADPRRCDALLMSLWPSS